MNGAGVPEGGPAPAFWTGLLTWLAEHDALLLFLSVLVEEGGVPLPVPSDVAVLVAAHRAARGEMSLLSVFLIVQAATLIGASVLYWAGRRAGRPLLYRYGGILHLDQARLAKVERMVTQHGALAVIGGRLVPGLRIVTPLACGVFRVPYRQFLPALAVASSVYLAVVIAVGVVGGRPSWRPSTRGSSRCASWSPRCSWGGRCSSWNASRAGCGRASLPGIAWPPAGALRSRRRCWPAWGPAP